MPNPFSGFIDRGRERVQNNLDPSRPERMRADASSTAVLDVLAQQAQNDPALLANPKLKTLIDLYQKDPKQAAQVLQNPTLLQVVPEPAKPAAPSSKEGKLVQDLTGFAAGTPEFQAELRQHIANGTAGEAIFGGTGLEAQMFNKLLARVPPDQQAQAIIDASAAYIGRTRTSYDPITQQPVTSQVDVNSILNRIPGAPQQATRAPGAAAPAAPAIETPPAQDELPPNPLAAVLPSGATLFDQAANLTGPDSFLARVVPKTPGLGGLTGETTPAAQMAEDTTEILVDALRTDRTESSRAIAEVESLRQRFGFSAELFSNPEQLQARSATARLLLDAREKEILARQANPASTSGETKKNDLAALARIRQVQPLISPPVLSTQEQIDEFFASQPKGSAAVIPDGQGGFKKYVVQ